MRIFYESSFKPDVLTEDDLGFDLAATGFRRPLPSEVKAGTKLIYAPNWSRYTPAQVHDYLQHGAYHVEVTRVGVVERDYKLITMVYYMVNGNIPCFVSMEDVCLGPFLGNSGLGSLYLVPNMPLIQAITVQ